MSHPPPQVPAKKNLQLGFLIENTSHFLGHHDVSSDFQLSLHESHLRVELSKGLKERIRQVQLLGSNYNSS